MYIMFIFFILQICSIFTAMTIVPNYHVKPTLNSPTKFRPNPVANRHRIKMTDNLRSYPERNAHNAQCSKDANLHNLYKNAVKLGRESGLSIHSKSDTKIQSILNALEYSMFNLRSFESVQAFNLNSIKDLPRFIGIPVRSLINLINTGKVLHAFIH